MKTWYKLKIADYKNQHQKKIQELAKNNPYPFKQWFQNGDRIYLPFYPDYAQEKIPPQDMLVINFLKQNQYQVVDYRGGICKKISEGSKKIRISNAIIGMIRKMIYQQIAGPDDYSSDSDKIQPQIKQKLLKIKDPRQIKLIISTSKADPYIKSYLYQILQYKTAKAQNILKTFISSKYRTVTKSSSVSIVISQNPHDIAKASTERGWNSCITLPTKQRGAGGMNAGIVYCQVQMGGLIAYLITSTDKNVQHPIARLSIRRFTNDVGKSYALPQNTVYGTNMPGFLTSVKKWLNQKQDIPFQSLILRGGGYSDTYGAMQHKHIKDMQQINQLLDKDIQITSKIKYKVQDNFSGGIFGNLSNSGVQPLQSQIRNNPAFRNLSRIFNTEMQAYNYKKQAQKYQGVAREFINQIKEQVSQNTSIDLSMRQIQKCLKSSRFSIRQIMFNSSYFGYVQKFLRDTDQVIPQNIVLKILQKCKKGQISSQHVSQVFANKHYVFENKNIQQYIINNLPQLVLQIDQLELRKNPQALSRIVQNLILRYETGAIQIGTVKRVINHYGYTLINKNNAQKLKQAFPLISDDIAYFQY